MPSDAAAPPSTPLMRQYHGLKQQVPNTLLMFRLGDFYELFYEDAVTAARELEITLTARNKAERARQPIPMCGVPYHSAENYIARLTQKGYRVAICEQMEAPSAAVKLVRREVTRIITPGTTMNASLLRSHENNFLGAVMCRRGRGRGLLSVDVTTGEFRATGDGVGRRGGGAGDVECARGVGAGWVRAAEVFVFENGCRDSGSSARIMRRGVCAITSGCCRSMGAGWRGSRWLRARRRRCCIICRRRSGSALDHLSPPSFYSRRADARWCWMLLRFGTWSLSSRCLRGSRRTLLCSRCWIEHARGWAAGCCGGGCWRLRLNKRRLRRGWMRWRNCSAERFCAANWGNSSRRYWIWKRLLSKISLASAGAAGCGGAGALAGGCAVVEARGSRRFGRRGLRDIDERLDEISEVRDGIPDGSGAMSCQ